MGSADVIKIHYVYRNIRIYAWILFKAPLVKIHVLHGRNSNRK